MSWAPGINPKEKVMGRLEGKVATSLRQWGSDEAVQNEHGFRNCDGSVE
jgi:hypothetical protein